jgi:uncharacterized membrane protein
MERVEVRFGEWIEGGFNLFKENAGFLILSSLIVVILSSVTVFILVGPMMGGLIIITLRLYDKQEPRPEVGHVFRGFNYFLHTFLFVLVWCVLLAIASAILNLLPCIGQLAALFVVFGAETLLLFGLFLIVDQGMEFWQASVESYNKVKTNFWPFLGFAVLASIIGSIGSILCGIGIIVTLPIQVCILTIAYREVFGDNGEGRTVEEEVRDTAEYMEETEETEEINETEEEQDR